jgi:predicted glutamine amidotransferase
MCELLGITATAPVDISFSFSGFVQRGGRTGPHADGWGLALFQQGFARTFLDESPASTSHLAAFLRDNPVETQLAVAHIRKKTRGPSRLANTHPFVRVFGGRHLVFAHNGTLVHVRERPLERETPIGDTDSEHAFCWFLERLRAIYGKELPDDPDHLGRTVFELANDLGSDGIFNVLISDGRFIFARCGDDLVHIVRRFPLGHATLADEEVRIDLTQVLRGPGSVAVVATSPLTRDEDWVRARPGTLWVFRDGELVRTFEGLPEAAAVAATAWRPGMEAAP